MENNEDENIKYIYSNRNSFLNFNSNKEKTNDISIKNRLVKKPMFDQKSLDFINNNDIIKEAVAYSKLRKLKKNLAKKSINNSESFNSFSQKNEIIQNLEKIKQGYDSKNNHQISFNQNELMNNSNSNNIMFTNNMEEISNKNISMSYAILPTLNLDNNNNYIIKEEKNLRIITDRINNKSTERINEDNNNVNLKNKKYIKNNIINELLLRNKKRKKNEQNTINYNNSFLNITVNQIRECPLFEKIKIPKDGHSRGIIEILKNYKQTKDKKFKESKSGEKNKNNENDNEKNNHNRKNVSKKKIKCLYDQKVFDEPKNKAHIMNRNFSYHKKILKNKKAQNNKNKELKITETNNKYINNEDINIIHNKTLSFNNIFDVKVPSLNKDDMINRNNNNRQKREILNNIYDIKDEFLYRKYINNKIKKKRLNDFYENDNRHLINIKYNHASSQSKMQVNYNNNNYSNYSLNKSRSESESADIKNNNYILSSSLMGSPMINNKMKYYRNQYLNDDEDNIFYQTLPNLNHSVNRYENISKNNKIEEIKINMRNNKSRDKIKNKNKDIIFNRTNPYPYNRGKLNHLNSSTNRYKNVTFEKEKNLKFVSFNNNANNNHERYSSDISFQNKKKMFKTNSSVNFKNNTILYLKPKNKLKKGLNSFYYSSYNFFKNKNISNDRQSVYTSPNVINESSPTSSQNIDFPLSKYNTNDENESENQNNNFNDINLTSSNILNINNNRQNNINSNENENLLNKNLKKISLTKLNYINSRIYKKPINKNILNNSKRNEDNLDSNSLSYKEEYIFVNKTSKTHNNNNQIIYRENIDKSINSKNKHNYNNEFEIINDYDNDNDSIDEAEIKMKIKNIKNGFINKYYNHCIKTPLQNNKNNNFTKKHLYKFKAKEKNKVVKYQVIRPQSSICYITKILITKNNLLIKKNDNNALKKKDNLKKVNKLIKEKDFKNLKKHKINKNNLNYDESNIKKNKNKSKNKNEKEEKLNLNRQKENIKNEIIYLLNILTSKNILSVENQLTKLIITSNNIFNIENNEYNAKLFLNDIINNENVFIEILINKVFSENKYITVYSKLCADLCNKYLNTINEVIINKCIDAKNKDNFNIIKSLKLKLKEECIDKFKQLINDDINEENKQKIFYLIEFIYQSMENEIIDIKICLEILNKLFNEYDSSNNKYHYLDIIIEFLFKLDKIDNFKDETQIIEKVSDIINSIDNEESIPSYLISKINKFKKNFNKKEKKNIEDKKTKQINFEGIALLIKEDMDNYYNYLKENDIEFDSNENIDEEIEKKYSSNILKTIKKIDLDEIIKYYIDICSKLISNQEQIICNNSYIKNIIKSVSHKLSLNKMRTFHKNILQILADISHICEDNKYLYETFGYLIYVLIINELCDTKDINIFINKDEKSKIAISKVIRYTIASFGSCKKKYYEEFKNIDLFKNNDFFDKYITSELRDILNFN